MRKAYCIAFPQTARLPDSCALLLLSLSLPLYPCFSSFTGDTHVGTAHFQTQMDLFRPQPFTFLSHHLENVFNRNLIFLVYSCLSSFVCISISIVSRSKRAFVQSPSSNRFQSFDWKSIRKTASRLSLDLPIYYIADIAKFWSDFGK